MGWVTCDWRQEPVGWKIHIDPEGRSLYYPLLLNETVSGIYLFWVSEQLIEGSILTLGREKCTFILNIFSPTPSCTNQETRL